SILVILPIGRRYCIVSINTDSSVHKIVVSSSFLIIIYRKNAAGINRTIFISTLLINASVVAKYHISSMLAKGVSSMISLSFEVGIMVTRNIPTRLIVSPMTDKYLIFLEIESR